jgi:hypothetical protein
VAVNRTPSMDAVENFIVPSRISLVVFIRNSVANSWLFPEWVLVLLIGQQQSKICFNTYYLKTKD